MKIGNEDNVRDIRLTHKGTKQYFRCFYEQAYDGFGVEKTQQKGSVCMEFSDLSEIDAMIEMLNRFRNDVAKSIGSWNVGSKTQSRPIHNCMTCQYGKCSGDVFPCFDFVEVNSNGDKFNWKSKEKED